MNKADEALIEAWTLADENYSDELHARFEALLPALIDAGYAAADEHTGHFTREGPRALNRVDGISAALITSSTPLVGHHPGMAYFVNREVLEERFGRWPSFHDVEVQAVRLDSGQQTDGKPSLELDIHVFDVDGVLPDGQLNFVRHTLATIRFEGVEAVELEGFGPQNVLFDLVFEDVGSTAPGTSRLGVSLASSKGLGGSFECEQAIVVSVSDFAPGPYSVYRRS